MQITLIGTGNLGTNLYEALRRAGHDVAQLPGRSFATSDVKGELVIIAVKDDALPDVANRLKDCDMLVVHTAGSIPMEVIPCRRRGVFYPMQTFSKNQLVDFTNIPIFLETEQAGDMKVLESLASTLSHNIYHLNGEGRRRLHLAAVFVCNFANHCYALGAEVLKGINIPFDVMLPLIDETASKVHNLSPREAQTGPAVRMDRNVISRQETMLDGRTKDIYHLMSESIHDLKI